MSVTITIIICALLLLAYVFDLTSGKTKIPSVVLLLLLGWIVRQAAIFLDISLPDFTTALPVLGTIGLILIVLEGSLELDLDRSKLGVVRKSLLGSLVPMLALVAGLAWMLHFMNYGSWQMCLLNAVPLGVISSSIAIPSVKNIARSGREFIIYESSFSDIFGVLLFNFLALNASINAHAFGEFGVQLLIIIAVSFVATLGLAYLISKIDHHVKFVPILLLVVLIYFISKVYHLPGLLFILLFGLFLGNIDQLKHYKWIQRFRPDELDKEVHRFRELILEGAFLIRAVFFLLFGYLIETSEVLNPDSLIWSVSFVALIFLVRWIQLKLSRLPVRPLLFVAPRGLINILLFLSVPASQSIPAINKSVIVQVILFTALIMMFGLMATKKAQPEESLPAQNG
jgi:Kef-type K+ transport system membrane component KefB